jgi:hypothetical protein
MCIDRIVQLSIPYPFFFAKLKKLSCSARCQSHIGPPRRASFFRSKRHLLAPVRICPQMAALSLRLKTKELAGPSVLMRCIPGQHGGSSFQGVREWTFCI